MQACAWRGESITALGVQRVLVSPLRRAIETALLAFDGAFDGPFVVCRHARELWWEELQNQPSEIEVTAAVLETLPRGDAVHGLKDALSVTPDTPKTEDASIRALLAALSAMAFEDSVAVVCHCGLIYALCGAHVDNGDIVECRYSNGRFDVVQHHVPPMVPRP